MDIDLDVFATIEDLKILEKDINQKFQKLEKLLKAIPNPELITIARSETPTRFTPVELVDDLEQRTLDILQTVYTDFTLSR